MLIFGIVSTSNSKAASLTSFVCPHRGKTLDFIKKILILSTQINTAYQIQR